MNKAVSVFTVQELIKAFHFTLFADSQADGFFHQKVDYQRTDTGQRDGNADAFQLNQKL